MTFASYARRIATALRMRSARSPLERLEAALRRGETGGTRYVQLCLDLGLAKRADAALAALPPQTLSPAMRVRAAALCGRMDEVIELTRSLTTTRAAVRLSAAELNTIIGCVAPVSSEAALALIRASGQRCPAEPALWQVLGDRDAAAERLEELGDALGPARWLLWANLHAGQVDKVEGLNRCLESVGLGRIARRDADAALAVGNLVGSEDAEKRQRGGLLSVVMTCFDSASHVGAALRSMFAQSYLDLEVIAVDDGSQDGTWPQLAAAAHAEPRLRAVRLKRNVGTYAAKNVGMALARGEFLAFQDADDWAHPERFSRCIQELRNRPELIAVTALYVRLQDDGAFWSSKVWPLLRWTPNSIVMRRDPVLRRVGAFDEHRFGADSEFAARVTQAFSASSVQRLDLPLILAARRDNSLMSARSSGLDSQGRSQARIDYQERWVEDLLRRTLAGESLRREPDVGTTALIAERIEGAR